MLPCNNPLEVFKCGCDNKADIAYNTGGVFNICFGFNYTHRIALSTPDTYTKSAKKGRKYYSLTMDHSININV